VELISHAARVRSESAAVAASKRVLVMTVP
jgi:hypothetical protein